MVDDWFADWLTEHRTRHPRAGLPDADTEAGTEVYDAWRANFIRRGVHDRDVATEASTVLVGEKLPHSSEHFPRLVEIAVSLYKARNDAARPSGVDPDSFEAARLASRDCGYCSGQGLAVAYDMEPGPRTPETVAAHCVCPAGRWMRRTIGGKDPALLRRIPDFNDVLDGRARWSAVPPIEPAEDLAGLTDPAAMLAALKRRLADHAKLPRAAPPAPDRRPGWPAAAWPKGDPILDHERGAAGRPDAPEPERSPSP